MARALEHKPIRRWTTWKSSLWRVLRGVWAAEAKARRRGAEGGVTVEQIWDQALRLEEQPIDYRPVVEYLKSLGASGLVVAEKVGTKTRYRSTTGEREAVKAELAAVFASALHGDPQLIELARRMLGESRP